MGDPEHVECNPRLIGFFANFMVDRVYRPTSNVPRDLGEMQTTCVSLFVTDIETSLMRLVIAGSTTVLPGGWLLIEFPVYQRTRSC